MAEQAATRATERRDALANPVEPEATLLLLLLARPELTAEQAQRAVALSGRVTDWETFKRIALEHQGLPLAYRHLSRLSGAAVPADVLDRMHRLALLLAAQSLRVEAAIRAFQDQCLAPTGARHAFLKGFPLGARYYDAPALRPCRDIDVLVDPGALIPLILRARRAGYRLCEAEATLSDRDLAAYCRFSTDVSIVSPDGVLIEVHKSLDQGQGLFNTRRLLRRSESVEHAGRQISVLRTSDLFVYVCAHHTRHFWSHLHWFADLEAVGRDASFDLAEVMRVAQVAGLASTVEACLELRELTADIGSDAPPRAGSKGLELMNHAIDCLVQGRDLEVRLRDTVLMGNFAFDWQLTERQRRRYRLHEALSVLHPWPADYRAWPLPPEWHGLYYFTRPVRLLWRRLMGRN